MTFGRTNPTRGGLFLVATLLGFVASATTERSLAQGTSREAAPPPGRNSASRIPDADWPAKAHPMLHRPFDRAGPNDVVKLWVFFEETKGLHDLRARGDALRRVAETYNARAIQRRRLRRTLPGLFDLHDVAVPAAYLQGVERTGARIHVVSKWLNAASVYATRRQLRAINDLPFVTKMQPLRREKSRRLPGGIDREVSPVSASATRAAGPSFYGESAAQLAQVNLLAVHSQGFTGAGVVVGILDTGFRRTHQAFNEPGHVVSVVAEWDFVNNDGNTGDDPGDASSQNNHGTYILGVLGAYKPNVLVGGAYDASFILCKTEDVTAEYRGEEDNYVAGLEFIEANGGDMATASLGYSSFDDPADSYTQQDMNGLTAVTTIGVNIATANGVFCSNAAGNGGHDADSTTSHLVAPADAFEVLAVGAVDDTGVIASFSSDGPTADGRVKPEILARGVNTRTVASTVDDLIIGVGGTSLSTPIVASVIACLIQAHPDWTVEQMRRYLTRTAQDYVATGHTDVRFVRGYGVVDAAAAAAADCNGNGVDDAIDIANGTSADCNANGIPDVCDIADGTLADANSDGVPDVCESAPVIPALPPFGAVVLGLLLASLGGVILSRRTPRGDTSGR